MSTFCKVFLCVLSINSLTSSYCWIYSNTYNTQGGKDWAPQTVHDPVHRTATYERGRALTNNPMITLSAPQRQSLVTNQPQIQFLGYSVKLIILQTVALKKHPSRCVHQQQQRHAGLNLTCVSVMLRFKQTVFYLCSTPVVWVINCVWHAGDRTDKNQNKEFWRHLMVTPQLIGNLPWVSPFMCDWRLH